MMTGTLREFVQRVLAGLGFILVVVGLMSVLLLVLNVQTPQPGAYPLKPTRLPQGQALLQRGVPSIVVQLGPIDVLNGQIPTTIDFAFDRASLLNLYESDGTPIYQQDPRSKGVLQMTPRALEMLTPNQPGPNNDVRFGVQSDCPVSRNFSQSSAETNAQLLPEVVVDPLPPGVSTTSPTYSVGLVGDLKYTAPMDGRIEGFPDDQYLCSYAFNITLPFPFVRWGRPSAPLDPAIFVTTPPTYDQLLSVSYEIGRTTSTNAPIFKGLPLLRLAVQRPWMVEGFAYAIALSPLLLASFLLYYWSYDRRRRSTTASSTMPIDIVTLPADLFWIAAIALTILPLRNVIVPSYITVYTHLDFVLATDLLALVGLACWRFYMWGSGEGTTVSSDEGTTKRRKTRSAAQDRKSVTTRKTKSQQ
jgi:hypothetical protein